MGKLSFERRFLEIVKKLDVWGEFKWNKARLEWISCFLARSTVTAWQIFKTDIWNHCRVIINNLTALCLYYQTVCDRQTVHVLCRFLPQNPTLLNDDWNSRPWCPPITLNSSRVYLDWRVKWDVEPFCVQTVLINSWLLKILEKMFISYESSWVCVHFCTNVNLDWSALEYQKWCLSVIMLWRT